MPSVMPGNATSEAEVLAATRHGLWLVACGREYHLSAAEFPWFQDASIRDVCHVELIHGHILRWPALDVDLDIASIEHPADFPLVWR